MSKKLNASGVNSAVKKTYEMKEFHLTDVNGEVWDVLVDYKMNPINLPKIAQEILVLMAKMKDEKLLENFQGYEVLVYTMFLKYYTDLKITEKKTAIETIGFYTDLLTNLISLNLFAPLIECFDKKTLSERIDSFNSMITEMSDKVLEEVKKQSEKEAIK